MMDSVESCLLDYVTTHLRCVLFVPFTLGGFLGPDIRADIGIDSSADDGGGV